MEEQLSILSQNSISMLLKLKISTTPMKKKDKEFEMEIMKLLLVDAAFCVSFVHPNEIFSNKLSSIAASNFILDTLGASHQP